MRDFIMAAVPLVVAGIALAVFFAGRAEKKKKREKENGYEAEGMSLGMCFGAAVGAFFPEYIGITLSVGMLAGLLVGMCVKKTVRRITVSFCQKEDWRAAVWGLC